MTDKTNVIYSKSIVNHHLIHTLEYDLFSCIKNNNQKLEIHDGILHINRNAICKVDTNLSMSFRYNELTKVLFHFLKKIALQHHEIYFEINIINDSIESVNIGINVNQNENKEFSFFGTCIFLRSGYAEKFYGMK